MITRGASVSRDSLRRIRATYWSSVLSLTTAPVGQAACISSGRGTIRSGCFTNASRIRNSVGVSATLTPPAMSSWVPGSSNGRSGGGGGVRRRPGDAPGERVHPGGQDREIERLGEVVVATGGKAAQLIADLPPRGQEKDHRLDPTSTQRLTDVPAICIGQSYIENDDVERVLAACGDGKGRCPGRCLGDLDVRSGQTSQEGGTQARIVLDDKNPSRLHRLSITARSAFLHHQARRAPHGKTARGPAG